MTNPNFGLLNQNGPENALLRGLSIGQGIAHRREQKEYRNALLQRREDDVRAKSDLAARQGEIRRAAAQGNEAALSELAGFDTQAFLALDKDRRNQAALLQEQRGNVAIDALRSGSPQAARQIVQTYAQNAGDNEAAAILEMSDEELMRVLRSEVAEAKQIGDLLDREDPNWRVVPQGGTVVDTNNPQALAQVSGRQQFQEGQTATNPQTGQQIVFRNGNWQPLRGAQ